MAYNGIFWVKNIKGFFDNENAHCIVKNYEINVNENVNKNSDICELMIIKQYYENNFTKTLIRYYIF